MQAPGDTEILALWERGLSRHPIDRALLLCAWARPDLPSSSFPDLPLGKINRVLLHLREICFGPRIIACIDCEHCSTRMEVTLDTSQLLAGINEDDTTNKFDNRPAEFEISNLRFRVPCSRDLAAISGERDIKAAAVKLLKQCCLELPESRKTDFASMLPKAEAAMEILDPAADINLSLSCEDCDHSWLASFNIGSLLWDEIDVRARALLAEVHSLAQAYGWTEPEIFALSPQRRAAYLDMVGI
ncbi:T4 family baseplate hub assembly chaperone [Candidatus Nitrotoga sp. M5]|uniref:T4 family baseplate hub assembly chaperone n=1 Tax=Candidatus Nitrotoga sp. M5 TaxID=2890409 RepID=UPI001EF5197E|nr:hypothetical protein [Candidatus Nitrotoga sp. M5]CAH1388049.1 conserved hypothetical protein [Candidatus Nitrotoga sp. M5]